MENIKIKTTYFAFVIKWFTYSFFLLGFAVYFFIVNMDLLAVVLGIGGLALLAVAFYKYDTAVIGDKGIALKSFFFVKEKIKWEDVVFISVEIRNIGNRYGQYTDDYQFLVFQTASSKSQGNDFLGQENGKTYSVRATEKDLKKIYPFLDKYTSCPRKGFKRK